ncbi:MAG: energy-coupling factor transporter ATPase [Clostridia bacterium]|nr:energy-coupling factor transporter ATPase [Clostridia bacterium]
MIEIQDVTYRYDENQIDLALNHVSLDIHEGEFTVILGHNGSGKSTIAKHLNAILLPSGGKVLVDGMDTVEEERLYELRQKVGMVFQNPDNQIVATIVEEDAAFGPENLGVPPQEIRERVDFALKAVGMYEKRNEAPHNLSGGQKQRIAIAGIIAMMPRYLVLDEPTAMLDPKGRREVMKTLRYLNKEHGMTIVLITHYMEEAAQADRVIVMDHGQVIIDDVPSMTFANVALLKSVGLDVPQVTDLMFRLRQSGVYLRHDLLTIDECEQELEKRLREIKEG